VKEMSVQVADFSEVRRMRLNLGSLPESLFKAGMLMKVDTANGGVTPHFHSATNATRPTTDALSGVTTLYGVALSGLAEANDQVVSGLPDYAGEAHTRRVFVAVCSPHRELILYPINSSGNIDYSQAVPANIGKSVGIYYRNISTQVGSNYYWVDVGATVGAADVTGYVIGITRDRRLIVRVVRGKWAELA
jgi:hypothetical protein